MKAEIVAVGTELLLGQIVDTNSAHIARLLTTVGLDVHFKSTVGDNMERLKATLKTALNRADVVITTGGIGPTLDDLTRDAVAEVTGRPLVFQPHLFEQIAPLVRRQRFHQMLLRRRRGGRAHHPERPRCAARNAVFHGPQRHAVPAQQTRPP